MDRIKIVSIFLPVLLFANILYSQSIVHGVVKNLKPNEKVYHILDDKLSRIMIKDTIFQLKLDGKYDTTKSLTYARIFITPDDIKSIDEYIQKVKSGHISTKNIYPYTLDTNYTTIRIDMLSHQIKQTGGSSTRHRLEYENEQRINSQQNQEFELIAVKSLQKHPQSKYSLHLMRVLLGGQYKHHDKIKESMDLLSIHHNDIVMAPLKKAYEQFLINNTPKKNIAYPPLQLVNTHSKNKVRNLMEQYENEFLVVDLWATWCGPCIVQHPSYFELSENYKADNRIAFMSISVDKKQEDVDRYLNKKPLPIDSYWLDSSYAINEKFIKNDIGVNSIPQYMIIDRKKELILSIEKLTDLKIAIDKLLAKK